MVRRFQLYGFGFVLGILVVSLVYKGRGCQLPNSAKMEELGWQKLEYSKHATCMMECRHITDSEIRALLGNGKSPGKGKINFDESEVHVKPYPTYAIEGVTIKKQELRVIIADADTISRVVEIIYLGNRLGTCLCP